MLILDLAWILAFAITAPLWLVLLVVKPQFRTGFGQRFRLRGDVRPHRRTIWLHGSSAGEVDLLRPLVQRIEEGMPDIEIVVSAFAVSGFRFASKSFAGHHVIWFPVDLAFVIRRFFKRLNPALIVVVESELWPNFFATAERQGIPLCVLNGKMSEKSHRKHGRTGLVARALRRVTLFAVQTDEHAERFRSLGVEPSRVHVTGNMKYDLADVGDAAAERARLRTRYGLTDDAPVWIGGSVHRGEDEALARVQARLVAEGRTAQLVVVPRYPAETGHFEAAFAAAGLRVVRKTALTGDGAAVFDDPACVLIVDTMGDLKRYYALSDVAYVGGSMHYRGSNKGGHNLMEPSILGVAPLFGPYNFSFQETVEALLEAGAGVQVRDEDELHAALSRFLDEPGSAAAMGAAARQTILDHWGATERNFTLIEGCLDEAPRG